MNKRFFVIFDAITLPNVSKENVKFIKFINHIGNITVNGNDVNCNGSIVAIIIESNDDEEEAEYPFDRIYRSYLELEDGDVVRISVSGEKAKYDMLYSVIDSSFVCGKKAMELSYRKVNGGIEISKQLMSIAIEYADSIGDITLIKKLNKC